MTVVRNIVKDAAQHPRRFAKVNVKLVAAANGRYGSLYDGANDETVFGEWTIETNSTGLWSIDLKPNAGNAPANSVYQITEDPKAEPHVINVPASGGPYWVGDVLVNPPAGLPTLLSDLLAQEIIDRTNGDATLAAAIAALTAAVNLKAPIASPSFTGTPLAPTANAGTSTTQIATTAFVQSAFTNKTYTPGQAPVILSVRAVGTTNPNPSPAWEWRAGGATFGTWFDTTFAWGPNASGAAPGFSWAKAWEANWHPGGDPNTFQGEQYETFVSPSGLVGTRLGPGAVLQGNLTNDTWVLIRNVDATEFYLRSVPNNAGGGPGTFTPAGNDWQVGFNRNGIVANAGANSITPVYSFGGYSTQLATFSPTYFHMGHGVNDGTFPGFMVAIGGPRSATFSLKSQVVAAWSLQGPSLNIPFLDINNSGGLGGVVNILQPPAGSGFVRALAMRESASPDVRVLEVRRADDSILFAVGTELKGAYVGPGANLVVVGAASPSYTGTGVEYLGKANAVPSSNPVDGFVRFVDPTDGCLKVRGPSGSITTLAVP